MLDLIRFDLLNWFYELWDLFVFETIDFMRCLDFVDVVRILFQPTRFCQFHHIPLLRDHQELACTPKDSPRRVDMNETSLIYFYFKKHWVIDKTVWKPVLVELLENRICAYIFQYIANIFLYIVSILSAIGRHLGASLALLGAIERHLSAIGRYFD